MRGLLIIIAVAALLSAAVTGQQQKNITLTLAYGANSSFDYDNDGVESFGSAIDFSVSAGFSWPVNYSNLCTRWHIVPEDSEYSTLLCYGAAHCCSLAELAPSSNGWNDAFYLASNLYSVSSENTVGAQVIYADYMDSSSLVDVASSEFSYLPATFVSGMLSSQSSATVTVHSPANSSALASGENVKLIITVDSAATGTYSIDGSANFTLNASAMGSSTNLTAVLKGSLPADVLNNSRHVVRLYINASENITLEHAFEVSDTSAPIVTLTNTSNATSVLKTSEAANITYVLNGISYNKTVNSSNEALLLLNVTNGINNLTINASDMHGNSNTVSHALNVTIESCTDAVQNFHNDQAESGVDCGGSCSSCINLSVSTDKGSYSAGELVYVQVSARSDAAHNITVTGPNYRTSLVYNGSTYYIINPPNAGQYTVNVTLKYRSLPLQSVTTSFIVNATVASNLLSSSINSNASEISVSDIVEFAASVSGNTSALAYKWDFNNDSVTDSTAQKANYSYSSPGDYLVRLNVSDGAWNSTASKTVTVYPRYNVTVTVRDKTTDTDISATVILDGSQAASPYSTQLRRGSYRLSANYSGYINYSSTLNVNGNESLILYLTTYSPPAVRAVGPDNDTVITTNATITFDVDKVPLTCTLLMGEAELRQHAREVVNSTRHVFYPQVSNGTFYWKVSCADGAGNTGETGIRQFMISQLSARDESIRADIQRAIDAVDTSLAQIDGLGREGKEVANAMNYRKLLDSAKFELQRAYRDIFNIKWRRLNLSDEEKFRAEIVGRVEAAKGNLTTNISVSRSAEFVSYPKDSTVELVAREYASNSLYTQAEISNYVAKNIGLQKSVSVTTKYTNVELTKYSGIVIKGTLIERRLTHDNISEAVVVEYIPKSLANSAADLEVYAVYKVVKDDPVIEIEPVGRKYSFLVKQPLTPVEIQAVETVVVKKKVDAIPKKKSGITGFAILNPEKLSSAKAVVAEILVLVLLGGLYAFYGSGLRESPGLKEIRSLVKKASSLTENQFDESERHYGQISELFRKLEKREKTMIYNALSELGSKIRRDHVLNKLREANILLGHSQRQAAISVYTSISELYKSLPEHHRKDLFNHCNDFHKKLSEKK